jgi:Domain of unknown function (DUF4340)
MSFKTTYILFGILILLLVAFGVKQTLGTKPGEELYVMNDLRQAKVTADDIDTLEIDRARPKEEKLVFVLDRASKHWKMTQPFEARADSDAVNGVIRNVINARKEERGKADLTSDLEKFGLQPPAEVIVLKQGGEHEWKLNVGKESVGGTANAFVYVTSSGQSKMPSAVKRSEIEGVFKDLNDFRSKDLLADSGDFGSATNVRSIKLHEAQHPPVALQKGSDDRWRFETPSYGEASYEGDSSASSETPKRINGVRDLVSDADNLRVDSSADFVANAVTDLAKYGLESNKPERLRIEIQRKKVGDQTTEETKEPVTRVLLVGKKADDKGEKLYARLDSEPNVVRVPAKNIDAIARVAENPSVLRNRDLTDIDQSKTDAIDIQSASGVIKLRKSEGTWKLFEGGKSQSADDPAIQDLLRAFTAKRQVESFPDPAKETELGFDKPSAVVSLWVDGLKKEEEKNESKDAKTNDKKEKEKEDAKKDAGAEPKLRDAKPTVKLTFGKKDGNVVYLRREAGSDKALVAVPATLLGKVDQGRLAFLDRTLPSFSENADVAGLVLERGGQTYDIEKEKKDDKSAGVWKLKQPKDLAGRAANAANVDRIVGELRGLRTDKLVSEKAAPAALEEYGLKSPSFKATVKVKDKDGKKTEDWVYVVGKETPDKTGRYAKESKSDFIFVVKPAVVETLGSELQDPTVFHFEPSKVKTVKLTGWKQAASYTFTLEAEQKSPKTWTVKTPADFDLDSDQVQNFVADLANLRATRFVVRQGAAKPEYKLAPSDRALHVELTTEGEKAPLTLTIGALDAKEKGYYAQSSTLPGDVFLISQDAFEKVLSGFKHFSKKSETK